MRRRVATALQRAASQVAGAQQEGDAPMLLLLGISPEGATATYRVGDAATNIISPLMVYFPLVLIFAQRWQKDFGIGSLTAMMIPYSVWMLITGVLLVMGWILFGLPLGPGAPIGFDLTALSP